MKNKKNTSRKKSGVGKMDKCHCGADTTECDGAMQFHSKRKRIECFTCGFVPERGTPIGQRCGRTLCSINKRNIRHCKLTIYRAVLENLEEVRKFSNHFFELEDANTTKVIINPSLNKCRKRVKE